MEGHASSIMGTSGDSISSEISSSRRDYGDGAEETARAQKKRKVRTPWSDKNTEQLLRAYRKRMDKSGRSFMTSADWQSISESVDGKAGKECQRRMDTLTKSFNMIKKHCAALQFSQLTEGELKLATKMEANLYNQMCEIKKQPQNAMVVPSPDSGDQSITSSPSPVAVMAGPEDDTIREMVGTPVPAWAARDPPRSTSPKGSAAPGLPTLADWPDHPHHSVNCVEAWIETLLCSPPHVPPVDLESSHIFEGLQPI